MAQHAARNAPSAGAQSSKPRVVPAIPHKLASKARAARAKAQSQAQSQQPTAAGAVEETQTPRVADVVPQQADVASPATPAPAEPDEPSFPGLTTPTASSSTPQAAGSSTQATSTADSVALQGLHEDEPPKAQAPSIEQNHHAQQSPPALQTNVRELPPPFYPSNHPSNPSSASTHRETTPARMQQFFPQNNPTLFASRRDSGTSSPAPLAMNPPFPFPPHASHPLPPGLPAGPGPSGGHSHALSEPFTGPAYPPPYFHNHPPGLAFPQPGPASFGQPRPHYPNMRHSISNRPDINFSPRVHNTRPPAPSPLPGQVRTGESHGPLGADPQTGLARAGFLSNLDPKLSNPTEDAFALAHYLQGQFGNREFADHMVSISHANYQLSQGTLACHGVVLARSPKLRSLMAMQSSEPSSFPKTLSLVIADRFINHDAIVARSISHLYAEPLLDRGFVENLAAQAPPEKEQSWERLRLSLAYAAMGHYLQVVPLVSRGIDLAATFLEWSNLSLALAFALDGGLGSSWSQSELPAEDRTSSSSYDESKNDSPASAPIYGIYSDRILNSVVQFLVTRFPVDFQLVSSAPQLVETPRLPHISEPRHARTGSRLERIQFGEMAVGDEQTLDPITERLSSILFSLPLPLLKHILEHPVLLERLGPAKIAEMMHTIIGEREQRRQRIQARGQPSSTASALEERLWHAIRWAERVEPFQQHQPPNCGFRLARQRIAV